MTAQQTLPLRISLGPLLYYWPRARVFDFYEQAAAWPVDTIYLGETVCAKRNELRLGDWLEIAARLTDCGKEVVLSTCELIESESDLRTLRKITTNGRFLVEANDLGAVRLLADKVPFVAGPYLNIYSRASLDFYHELGAVRWVLPIELGHAALREMLAHAALEMDTEVFSYGRLPLAVSARCFTARYNNLSKDDCGFRCIEHPDGLLLSTQDDAAFLVLNGLQTQSAKAYNLIGALPAMIELGVDRVRISPQSANTVEVINLFQAVIHGVTPSGEADGQLKQWMPGQACDGYWYGKPGLTHVFQASRDFP